ncbi:MAG TPA: pilus assembly protein TadG-related protein [Sphingomicrobium sp.]|nr:pilus assembly protein TadG-related protein [Sphingomicrobium sp.]
MNRQLIGRGGDNSGAVAATVGLSLFALVAVGGIAFDYARLATLDTEMQNAADQAALAAATQLDKEPGAIARATAAAQGLIANQTLLANDGDSDNMSINIPTVLFYATKAAAEAANGTDCPTANVINPADAGADASAKFVCVRTTDRVARYALTPIVAAFVSNDVSAMAVAGLGSAICKIPPLMMCNPQENEDPSDPLGFDISDFVGHGLRLVEGGGGSWAPGNFGYLQTGLQPGANALEYALGANSPPGDCVSTEGVTTKPGENTSVTDGINTRFDIFENGLTNACTDGTCSPALNVRKDVTRPDGSNNFGFKTGNDPWDLPVEQYLPDPATGAETAPWPTSMGHPRDICHARDTDGDGGTEYCPGQRMGDGAWDRNLYFFVNHGPGGSGLFTPAVAGTPDANWQNIGSLDAFADARGIDLNEITRYQVYLWEIDQIAAGVLNPYTSHTTQQGQNIKSHRNHGKPVPPHAGVGASASQLDRRISAVAVVNCAANAVAGQSKNVAVAKWVEVFFVEPSLARPRTSAGDIYVEIIRETTAGGNAPTNPQVVRRDVPYLIK